jgi:hypothetical protein
MVSWIETINGEVHFVEDRDGSDFETYCNNNIAKEKVNNVGSRANFVEDVASSLRTKVHQKDNDLSSFCEDCYHYSKE